MQNYVLCEEAEDHFYSTPQNSKKIKYNIFV
jgi:hypothetical protein